MKASAWIVSLCVACLMGTSAFADVLHFVPKDADLGDLDHNNYYVWGIDSGWPAKDEIVSAKLTFSQIRDWTGEQNVLYVELLDSASLGVRAYEDNEGGGNNFKNYHGLHETLATYQNLPTKAQTIVYEFTQAQLEKLSSYAADGRFGIGLDPDCHFYNCGVSLDIVTGVGVPEPSSLVLVGLGAVGALLRRRRAVS